MTIIVRYSPSSESSVLVGDMLDGSCIIHNALLSLSLSLVDLLWVKLTHEDWNGENVGAWQLKVFSPVQKSELHLLLWKKTWFEVTMLSSLLLPLFCVEWHHSMTQCGWNIFCGQTPLYSLLTSGCDVTSIFNYLYFIILISSLSVGTVLFSSVSLGFSSHAHGTNCQLTGSSLLAAHITLHCLITDLFSTFLCALPQPSGSLAPVKHRFSIAMIAMTHKRGYPALAS